MAEWDEYESICAIRKNDLKEGVTIECNHEFCPACTAVWARRRSSVTYKCAICLVTGWKGHLFVEIEEATIT